MCLPTESGIGQTAVSCPACHTGLWNYYADAGPHLSYIRVGTLDRPWEIEADVHLFTRNRPAWMNVNDGKPSFEEYYGKREDLLRDDALKRYEMLKPKINDMWTELKASWQ